MFLGQIIVAFISHHTEAQADWLMPKLLNSGKIKQTKKQSSKLMIPFLAPSQNKSSLEPKTGENGKKF